jgi:hypothetical protein
MSDTARSESREASRERSLANLRPFVPGQSGNPSGRARGLERLAREHTEAALEVLVQALQDEDTRNRITAASMILDRGWGKPAQTVTDATTGETVTFLHLVAMRAFSDELNAQRVVDGDVVSRETTTDNTTQSQPRNLMEPATE